jgi:GT2 family glycosyltransferase
MLDPGAAPAPAALSVEPGNTEVLRFATWLTEDIVLLVARLSTGAGEVLEGSTDGARQRVPVELRCLVCADEARLLAISLPAASGRRPGASIRIQAGTKSWSFSFAEIKRRQVNLKEWIEQVLGKLEEEPRSKVHDFLAPLMARARDTTQALWLSSSLSAIHEALRRPLPHSGAAKEKPAGLCVDEFFAIDNHAFYLKGWLHDAQARTTRLTAVSPEGHRAELLERVFRYRRPDVDKAYGLAPGTQPETQDGFLGFFEITFPNFLNAGWRLETSNALGAALEASVRDVTYNLEALYDKVLLQVTSFWPSEAFIADHAYPALKRVLERCRQQVQIEDSAQFGTPPAAPDVSIIVPLRHQSRLEHQLVEFVQDGEIQQADLIYVLDNPAASATILEAAYQLFQLYRVPFRLVTLKGNLKFVRAEEIGVSLARGRLLVFLQPQVFPDRPGWLGAMRSFYDSHAQTGALAPKLMYEDNALHHAGISFVASARALEPATPFRGLHRAIPDANGCRQVPAVGGDCFMIDAALYNQFGGADPTYLNGVYKDADLCLRLREAGRQNWYFPEVELYFLGAPAGPRQGSRGPRELLNSWLFKRSWNQRLRDSLDTDRLPRGG